MNKFVLWGFVLVWLEVTGMGFAQYAPVLRNSLPPNSGFSIFPTPVKPSIPKSRVLRRVRKPVPTPKKSEFIPLYPNANATPTPAIRNQVIRNLPKNGPTSVLAPRKMPYSSLYQDPH